MKKNDDAAALMAEKTKLIAQRHIFQRRGEYMHTGGPETLAALDQGIEQINALIARAMEPSPDPAPAAALPVIPWIGTDVDFADLILELRDKGYIETETAIEALRLAAPHFGLDTKGLRQGRERRIDNKQTGRFGCIPPAEKKRKGGI